jgi:hypothetical protein
VARALEQDGPQFIVAPGLQFFSSIHADGGVLRVEIDHFINTQMDNTLPHGKSAWRTAAGVVTAGLIQGALDRRAADPGLRTLKITVKNIEDADLSQVLRRLGMRDSRTGIRSKLWKLISGSQSLVLELPLDELASRRAAEEP